MMTGSNKEEIMNELLFFAVVLLWLSELWRWR